MKFTITINEASSDDNETSFNKPKFIKWVLEYFKNKETDGDITYYINDDGFRCLALNNKTASLTFVKKGPRENLDTQKIYMKQLQIEYWYDNGQASFSELEEIIKLAGFEPEKLFKSSKYGAIQFANLKGGYTGINYLGGLIKIDSLDKESNDRIKEAYKKVKPGLRWYFKFFNPK